MKSIYKSTILISLLFLCTAFTPEIYGQGSKIIYTNIDWQWNLPVGNDYANVFSGWGANIESGYFVTENVAVGAFLSFHTNNKYIERQTLQTQAGAITTDQQHSIFQLPFGLTSRYVFSGRDFVKPYLGAKIGASYSKVASYMNIYEVYDKPWGFFISPEIGATFYPNSTKKYGIHLATYYSYATNSTDFLGYSVNGLHNWGIRLGVEF